MRRAPHRRPPLRRFLRDLALAISDAGGKVYLVGGYLRNIVEGREAGDIDLLVTGLTYRRTGEVLRSLSPRVPGIRKVVAAGKHFPVHRIAVDWGKEHIDVSNARPGGPARRPRTASAPADDDRDAIEDVSRRDFTINGLLLKIPDGRGTANGRLLDPFGGIEDIRGKRIRCIGDARDRFREDPLRIVRAIRLRNERRGFVLHTATASAIRRVGPRLLPAASPDRTSVELVRSLSSDPVGTIGDLLRLGLLRIFFPEYDGHLKQTADRIAGRYRFLHRSLGAPLPLPILLGNLLADLPLEAAMVAARRLRLPNLRSVASTLRCLHILSYPDRLRFPLAETESALLAIKETREMIAFYRSVERSRHHHARDLTSFTGKCRDMPLFLKGIWLDKNGYPEGPARKELLLRIREETLAGRISSAIDAERLAESLRQEYNHLWKGTSGGNAT